jgi:hypothetical protein
VERMLQREAELLRQVDIPVSESDVLETIERLRRIRTHLENHPLPI